MEENGSKLREARSALGMTQEQLAAIFGITSQHISDMERGKSPVRRAYLLVCEGLLNTPKFKAKHESASTRMYIRINERQLRSALEYVMLSDDDTHEVAIEWMPDRTSYDGEKMPAGLYLYEPEYQEDGVIGPLGE